MNSIERTASLIILLFLILIVCLVIWGEDARADAPIGSVTDAQYVTDNDEVSLWSQFYGHAPPVVQMNGTMWNFDIIITTYGSEQAIWGYFSTDKGHTYNGIMIMDETDPGFEAGGYPFYVCDASVLSNNSIILLVLLWDYDTIDGRELHLLCHWNNTDLSQWERLTIYSSINYDVEYNSQPSMAVNSTDILAIGYARTTTWHYGTWDMTDRLQDDSWSKAVYYHRDYHGPWILCNSTDVFTIGTVWVSAVDYIKLYSYDGSWTELWSQGSSSSYRFYDCVVTSDDTTIAVASTTSGGYCRFYYYNETDYGTRYYIAAGNTDGFAPKLCLVGSDPEWFTLIQFHTTADRYKTHSNYYWRDQEVWKDVSQERWQETESTTKDFAWMGMRDLYPRFWDAEESEWIYTQLPLTGWAFTIGDYDTGADNEDHHFIHLNSTTWPAIPWWFVPPPKITTIILTPGTYGEYYRFGMEGEDGTLPYIWSILAGPIWLEIGASNGTIHGDPSGVGTWSITIRVTETHDAPRHNDEIFSLKIESGITEPEVEPGYSDILIKSLWMLLASISVAVMVVRVITGRRVK